MGESSLRCITCLGKFGPATSELRCNLCVTLFRLQCLLVSEHFPADQVDVVYPEIRGAYIRALEVVDVQRPRASQGGEGPPSAGDKALPLVEGRRLLTSSKARPPSPPKGTASSSKDKEKRNKKDKDKVKKKRERSRSRQRKKRSPSPVKRKRRSKTPDSPEEEIEEGEEEEGFEDDPVREEENVASGSGRREGREASRRRSAPKASPRRPRSPPGPPPDRREESVPWAGPILAYRGRQEERPPIERRFQEERRPKNKGRKKKRQQKRYKRNKRGFIVRRRS